MTYQKLIEQNKLKEENQQIEFKEFANRLHSDGRIISDLQNTVIDFMETVYNEGGSKALNKFKEYLIKQPKIIE